MKRRPLATLHSLEGAERSVAATLEYGAVRHRISYRADGVALEKRYDAFVAAALPIAMRRARKLRVAGEVSPRLLAASAKIQDILDAWVEDLRVTRVAAEAEGPPAAPSGRGTAAFFTAGVDSFYTALRHRKSLDALIFVHGFDVPLDAPEQRRHVTAGVRRAAAGLGIPLVEVETDLRSASNGNCGWGFYHGAALASVALLLGSRFERVLFPATNSWRNLFPWGSHPLLDPLWTTEAVELVHEGKAPRIEKLSVLAGSAVAMETLRVCYQAGAEYNCSRCRKCLQTMAGLRLIGALDRCATFPNRLPLRALGRLQAPDDMGVTYLREHLAAAEALGSDPALTRALRKVVRRGPRRAVHRRRMKKAWRSQRIGRRRLARSLRLRVARLRPTSTRRDRAAA